MKRWTNILIALGMFLVAYRFRYQLSTRTLARWLRLPPQRYKVGVKRAIRIPTHDGLTLATDHYFPLTPERLPTILIRSPYGREPGAGAFGVLLNFMAHRFAERGYHVVVQDTRGRFDSDGEFNPPFDEPTDGRATLDWLNEQPWFNGAVGLWGPSYLGIVQWAIASQPEVKALVPIVTSSQLQSILYPDGVFDLGLALRWLGIFQALDQRRSLLAAPRLLSRVERTITPGFHQLPLSMADAVALGAPVAFYRMWLEHHRPDDAMWQYAAQIADPAQIVAPVHLIGGWYDFFLRGLLADYAGLRAVGRTPYLTIGPWFHFSNAMVTLGGLREGLIWFDAHLKGNDRSLRQKPVRLFVMGANEWREMDDWPPPAQSTRYYLHPARWLAQEPPHAVSSSEHYRYDPADPTPAVGGTQFSPWAGPRDNRKLEARSDVLTYTTAPLDSLLEVIGPVCLELYVRSSLDYTDFFGRLCDVYPDGRSINVCDGLYHVEPGSGQPQPDGSLRIEIDLWATAHRFRPGHRIRLQVSSGAHPRWTRNLGTGEPVGSGTIMKTANQTVYHDSSHPSALVLPVVNWPCP
jgi:putative CocE/NonD family hydrolase